MQRRDFIRYSLLSGITALPLSASLGTLSQTKLQKGIPEDIYLHKDKKKLLYSSLDRINRVKRTIGYGNFNIIGFYHMIKIGKRYSSVGKFTKDELVFMEEMFYEDPTQYGFFGKKITQNITDTIKKKDVKKIPYTGHYLFKDTAIDSYEHMCKDIGKTLILTSGVRGVVKQFSLYFDKIKRSDLNMNTAVRSLAPPAYTYHLIGDFDVGKKGLGYDNFTSRFALTTEFAQMRKLKYIDVRYTINNIDGVRYEPWHVKII